MSRRGTNLYFRGVSAFGHPSPALTRDSAGRLTRIDYGDGAMKQIAYRTDGRIDYVDLTSQGTVLRKTMTYNSAGDLTGITETVI